MTEATTIDAETGARPLPLTLEEIDAEWLTQAIGVRHPGITVTAASIVDVNHGTCTKVRVALEVDAAGRAAGIPPTVIVKGGFEPHSRGLWLTLKEEVHFYRDFAPSLPPEVRLPTPQCYFADFDAELRQGISILEDLVARGVTFCDARVPHRYDQLERRLTVLARYHAATWDSPELRPGGAWSYLHGSTRFQTYFHDMLDQATWDRFLAQPRATAVSTDFHDLGWVRDAVDQTVAAMAPLPISALHGDTHLGNLYEDPDGSPGFYDSIAAQGPPLIEVTYHMGCALDTNHRREWERPLVQHYLDELGCLGVAGVPDIDAAMHQYAMFLFRGFVIFMINENHWQPESVNTAYTARFNTAMIDHHTKEQLAAV